MSGELIILNENGVQVKGLVLTLQQDFVCAVILGRSVHLTTQAIAFRTGTVVSFPIGFNLWGVLLIV
jgi:F0F1-type ATP synthase alpha subunit